MGSETEWMVDYIKDGGDLSKIKIGCSTRTVGQQLNEYIGRKDISVTALAGLSAVNRANLYKIMGGTVTAGRNTMLRLALVLELNFDETQELLKASGNAQLTARSVRDRYISQAVIRKSSIDDLDSTLLGHQLNSIYGKTD